MNKVVLNGRAAREVESRAFTGKNGENKKVISTVLAVKKGLNGTDFIPVEIFALADVRPGKKTSAANYYENILKKGNLVELEGHLQMDSWEKDGQKFSKLKVVADRIDLLSVPAGQKDGQAQQAAPAQQAQPTATVAPAPVQAPQNVVPEGFLVVPTSDDEELPF